MTILWKALARRDMQQIHAHIAHYAGAAHAYEALAEIHIQINNLADHPALGRAGPKPGTRFIIVTHHDVDCCVALWLARRGQMVARVSLL